ncbi:MAG: hypothetical protein KGI38_04440 [Thaumarchaeota archaeon]|nr:hypothetical protein [Nitrososphaerota archaeon]
MLTRKGKGSSSTYSKKKALYNKEWARKHHEIRRRIHHRSEWKRHGLDEIEAERVYDSKSSCDICRIEFDGDLLKCLDHERTSQRIRGVLCSRCNLAIGLMQKDTRLLTKNG